MATVFLGVGSNLGDRSEYIQRALSELKQNRDIQFVQSSEMYETDPVGGPDGQGKYLNVVWQLETQLSPDNLLSNLLRVEQALGRERSEKNSPRTIDLDILFYDDQILNTPSLKIPHPRLHERAFVLKPLCDLIPERKHPVLQRSLRDLMSQK